MLGGRTFAKCANLRKVTFGKDSRLKYIGKNAFCECRSLEAITLPGTLKEARWGVFCECESLKTVYVQDGCEVEIFYAGAPNFTKVGPPQDTSVGGAMVWDLRGQKDVTIPEGAEKIGNYWFYHTDVESVTVPASVREIGMNAFHGCMSLTRVQFQEGSKLEKIGIECFQHSALEKIAVPKSV